MPCVNLKVQSEKLKSQILQEKYRKTDAAWMKEELSRYMSEHDCSICNGYRLKQESLCVKIDNLNIGQVARKTIYEAGNWFETLEQKLSNKHNQIAGRVIKEIKERLNFLNNVGLEYLSLSRESGTLSGGESQRINLATSLGSSLVGSIYILDEPSIGLHPRDNEMLIQNLKRLARIGNSVIIVEHDEDIMRESDYIVDIGPRAGVHGGQIIFQGTYEEIITVANSDTGAYLS